MENKIFRQDAKSIVDMLFDKCLFTADLTRDDLNAIEDVIEHSIRTRFESTLKAEQILSQIKK